MSCEGSCEIRAGRDAASSKGGPAGPTAAKAKSQVVLPGSQSEYGQGGKARTGGERRAGKEQNRTGHLKRELIPRVSSWLFSHSYATVESRSTHQCWVTSYFMFHKLRDTAKTPKHLQQPCSVSPESYPDDKSKRHVIQLKHCYTNVFIFPFYMKIIVFSPKSSLPLENYCRITLTSTSSPAHTSNLFSKQTKYGNSIACYRPLVHVGNWIFNTKILTISVKLLCICITYI